MGKRTIAENSHVNNQIFTPVTIGQRNIRKRKLNDNNTNTKHSRFHASINNCWHENDDEDSSSSDGVPLGVVANTPRNVSSKQANNSSILLNNSLNLTLTPNDSTSAIIESPKPVYTLRPSVVNGTILYDLTEKPWRLGRPIGKGNFGEIFLASDNISIPVTNENAKFVVKIEPHSNGPLFVEIHCLMKTAKKNLNFKEEERSVGEKPKDILYTNNEVKGGPSGIPDYIGSGSHYFGNARYRFLVLPRFDRDLHSIIKKCRVHEKSVLSLAIHIINVLENLHAKGYCHNDVKAQNLMISKCKYLTQHQKTKLSSTLSDRNENIAGNGKELSIKSSKYEDNYDEKQQTTDSGNSSEQEGNDEDEDFVVKRKVYNKEVDRDYEEEDDESPIDDDDEDEDFDDGATTNSMNSNSVDMYLTPINKSKHLKGKNMVQYSGSNPVRSCRREKTNSTYDEMVKSHYLRPSKRISYTEFFNEDGISVKSNGHKVKNSSGYTHSNTSDQDSEDFIPISIRRSIKLSSKKPITANLESRRLTRRQEKLVSLKHVSLNMNCTMAIQNGDIKNKFKSERNTYEQCFEVNEERIFLIDYGLASKFIDNGVHRPFVMDQRRAHDGTLEFTSRDAHMGAHSRRSDMECLGYNLLFWSQGYLPWKEAAINQQQEKVHRAKEFLMTDVRELLRQIYGAQVPKYLGDYLHLVGQLAYHERPDYNRYRQLFEREFEELGYPLSELRLQMNEIQQTCVRITEDIENKDDFFETNKNNTSSNMVLNIMQNISVSGTPFHDRTLSNRVSPKNLRSKSHKKNAKKKRFSWAEILSQDPDQIARERAEKEFDREEELSDIQPVAKRYKGKPTKAIIQVLALLGRSVSDYEEETKSKEYIQKGNKLKNKIESEECYKSNNYENEGKYERVDNDKYYQEQSIDDGDTDATEVSEKYTHRKIKAMSTLKQKTNNKQKNNKNSKKTSRASRKLILKTTEVTPQIAVSNNTSLTSTPICASTRRRKAATTVINLIKPSSASKTNLTKSGKKHGNALTTSSHKSQALTVTSSATSTSTSIEIEQYQKISNKKRVYRTKRQITKSDVTTSESIVNDSNSNFGPVVWKMNTEAIYSRNCKK